MKIIMNVNANIIKVERFFEPLIFRNYVLLAEHHFAFFTFLVNIIDDAT
jgi:hypothetical protein